MTRKPSFLRVALAQINVTVGALEANRKKILDFSRQAKAGGADLVLFPELALPGYPPEDLLFKSAFVRKNRQALNRLVPAVKGVIACVGFADKDRSGALTNAAAIISHGKLAGTAHKIQLPNYGVFDEKRYFKEGRQPTVVDLKFRRSLLVARKKGRATSNKSATMLGGSANVFGGQLATEGAARIGVSICEDIWEKGGPCLAQTQAGSRILINLSASPYHAGKHKRREQLLIRRAKSLKSWICYLNLVGGQDELVFDGGSLVVSPSGKVVFRAPQFQEGLYFVRIPLAQTFHETKRLSQGKLQTITATHALTGSKRKVSCSCPLLAPDREIYEALVLGLRDYVRKNGFSHVVLGLSGGIDSSLTAGLAVAALGPEAVIGISMPSRYSSLAAQSDAKGLADALGIRFMTIPIERMFEAALDTLRSPFVGRGVDVTEENIQARIRGLILMALSNKFHWLVLATGNKSEISTGYCTLYGDLVGGFAVIKDLPKTGVVRLSRTLNRVFARTVIPSTVFTRPPSAELRANQKDQDSLPAYSQLDAVMRAYVEGHLSAGQIRASVGVSSKAVQQVLRLIDQNEYKRRQAPIGIKITPLAFGRDRRMPITNHFREV